MTLTKPDFRLDTPIPSNLTDDITPASWWLWLRLKELEPKSLLGGIYANKRGFHNKGKQVSSSDYSVRDAPNRTGPWWRDFASAIDWTFSDAQKGQFGTIDKYTSRLVASAQDAKDPRLDMILYEFFGQADWDRDVEGWDEYHDRPSTSDDSHLWHIHMSFLRSKCGDFWSMWALLTVLMGWTVAQWRASLPAEAPKPPTPKPPTPPGIPTVRNGSRMLRDTSPDMKGTDVLFVQRWIGPAKAGKADGVFGAKTAAGVKWYQRMRGLSADGIVGPKTWRAMGIK